MQFTDSIYSWVCDNGKTPTIVGLNQSSVSSNLYSMLPFIHETFPKLLTSTQSHIFSNMNHFQDTYSFGTYEKPDAVTRTTTPTILPSTKLSSTKLPSFAYPIQTESSRSYEMTIPVKWYGHSQNGRIMYKQNDHFERFVARTRCLEPTRKYMNFGRIKIPEELMVKSMEIVTPVKPPNVTPYVCTQCHKLSFALTLYRDRDRDRHVFAFSVPQTCFNCRCSNL